MLERMRLTEGWTLLPTTAGRCLTPDDLPGDGWRAATVPGTVAESLGLGADAELDLERDDWWYRCVFAGPDGPRSCRLVFDGLATLAEGWLDGQPLLRSRNMHLPVVCELPDLAPGDHTLVICFRSLRSEPSRRQPRLRWKTALVDRQELRWVRTSLLGRIPGWAPRLPVIGPWRAVVLEATPELRNVRVHTTVVEGLPQIGFEAHLSGPVDEGLLATLFVGDRAVPLFVASDGGSVTLSGSAALPGLALWWPHTYGEPHLHMSRLVLEEGGEVRVLPLAPVGFRTISMDRRDGQVQLVVNGRAVFCRGACWTAANIRSPDGSPEELEASLRIALASGLNMLRIGGTMVYGSEELYTHCDALGILVWQDFMFANMDYPFADPAFRAEVEAEVCALLQRLQRHPSLAVYCGGSEIEQQAAMLGLPASEWSAPFFAEVLPALCATHSPGTPYFPSTPCEGALPFHTSVGLAHYYGVGAYLRPLSDVRLAGVRFTPECLGFANVPDAETLLLLGPSAPPHHPAWKAGVPRDTGAGWDFDDVRDHYLSVMFGVNPALLRSTDLERYLALSRAVTGELMLRTYAEWRRPGSGCGGALVWFLKDLRPGAGWGIVDSTNRPKAAWWYLRRAWARQAVLLTDRGLDGVDIHVYNETAAPLVGTVELRLLRGGRHTTGSTSAPVQLAPYASTSLSADALLGAFTDIGWAYRFGPPRHEVVTVRLVVDGVTIHEDTLFPLGYALPRVESVELTTSAVPDTNGDVVLTLRSDTFLQTVSFACAGFVPSEDYFHLAPDAPRTVRFTRTGTQAFKVYIGALNTEATVTVRG